MSDEATFAASTEAVVSDTAKVSEDVKTDANDAITVVTDETSHAPVGQTVQDMTATVSDGEVTIADVHKIVTDIHNEISSIKDVVVEVKPHLEALMQEVKDKGIAGLIPAIMAAFRS